MGMQRDKWHEMLRKDENLEKRLKRDIKKLSCSNVVLKEKWKVAVQM